MNALIGNTIKQLRLKTDLTREDLAIKLGVSYSAIAMYEQGNRQPDIEILLKMCKIFNYTMDYLVGLTSEAKRLTDKKQSKLEQILELVNELSIQEANYLIKQLNKAKIYIEKEDM